MICKLLLTFAGSNHGFHSNVSSTKTVSRVDHAMNPLNKSNKRLVLRLLGHKSQLPVLNLSKNQPIIAEYGGKTIIPTLFVRITLLLR